MARPSAFAFWLGIATLACVAMPCAGDVTVEQKPIVIEHKTFDPAHRPPEMPPLKPGEAAVTESLFDCAADLTYKVVDRTPTNDGCTTTLRVQSVHLTLSLKVLLWLPAPTPAKLAAHEEGHKQIDQRIYDEAKPLADQAAKSIDGQILSASAVDCTTAENKAAQSAAEGVCKRYLQSVGQRTERINQEYDKITVHGTKASPAEAKAVEQAFDREHPKT